MESGEVVGPSTLTDLTASSTPSLSAASCSRIGPLHQHVLYTKHRAVQIAAAPTPRPTARLLVDEAGAGVLLLIASLSLSEAAGSSSGRAEPPSSSGRVSARVSCR